jgi:serine/threonine protein kinase/tetratricopeptide (TPR) repeat protein
MTAPESPDPAEPTPTHDAPTLASPLREGPGTRIGPYKILQLIGEGGFGSVFMAEQERPVQRRVALKIIKLGMDTRQVIARFEAERQALSMMEHPNIARVLDGGATDAGRPYFVMELVKGEPIVEYCDKNSLHINDRLELFVQVCLAVQHAHTKGVIHRDIKPSNILVSTQDGKPATKVIDFGIAKATSAQLTDKTLYTQDRQLIGTPEYMSPEQAEGSLDIDTRSDVYSLGVLLYELLTGVTPFSGKELRSSAQGEIQRIIREVDPPRPSTRLSQSGRTLVQIASKRHVDPRRLSGILRGDLDWIVMKALEKDRQRRYETANGLATDVRRHLAGEAVQAAPPSTAYRVRTFVRRHRAGVITAGLVGFVLVAGTVGTTWGLILAARANAKLTRSQASAQARYELAVDAVKTLHTGLIKDFLLQQDQFKDLRSELLQSASGFYEKLGALLKDTDDLASRRDLLAANYEVASLADMVGRKEDALALHRRVLQGREELAAAPGVDPAVAVDLAQSLLAVGDALEQTGQIDQALAMYQRAKAAVMPSQGGLPGGAPARSACASAQERAGNVLSKIGREGEALQALGEARDVQKALVAANPLDIEQQMALASTHRVIGLVLMEAKPAEALAAFEQSRVIVQKLAESSPGNTRFQRELSNVCLNLGVTQFEGGALVEGRATLDKSLALARKLADANPAVIQFQFDVEAAYNAMGHVLRQTRRFAQALEMHTGALAIMQRLTDANPNVTRFQSHLAGSYNNIGWVLEEMGRFPEALEAQRKALVIRQAMADSNHEVTQFKIDLAWCHGKIGILLMRMQRPAEALTSFEAARSIQAKLMDADPSFLAAPGDVQNDLAGDHARCADALYALRRLSEAHRAYQDALATREGLVQKYPATEAYRRDLSATLRGMGLTRAAEGDPSGAAANLRRALELLSALAKQDSETLFEAACCSAGLSALAGREGSGVPAAQGSVEADRAMAFLARALALGGDSLAACRTEAALDPLRGREDFKKLMADLEREPGPG